MVADSGKGAKGLVAHDEIVKALLKHQRRLRSEGATGASGRTATEEVVDVAALEVGTEPVVDLTAAEAQAAAPPEVPRAPAPEPVTAEALEDLRLRLVLLETALVDLAGKVHALRVQAQESAIAVDEQLAEIQDLLIRAPEPPADAI